MIYVSKTMLFVLKTMICVLKTRNFEFKILNSAVTPAEIPGKTAEMLGALEYANLYKQS